MVKSTVKDDKPQWLNMPKVVESAANTYTETKISTPCVNQLNNGKALVMEILRIMFYLDIIPQVVANQVLLSSTIHKKTNATLLDAQDANVISRVDQGIAAGAAAGSVMSTPMPMIIELTDSKGNGMLYGGKEIFIGVKSVNSGAARNASAKILYRLVEVSANELIGIIQE